MTPKKSMRTLSKVGWFCAGVSVIVLAIVFGHYNGFVDPAFAFGRMASHLFWGGLEWAALLTLLMAILFLSA